jgi:hypothetical protein
LINAPDQSTTFIVKKAFPSLALSFFIYGFFPIICSKIGLVDEQSDDIDENKETFINSKEEDGKPMIPKGARILSD